MFAVNELNFVNVKYPVRFILFFLFVVMLHSCKDSRVKQIERYEKWNQHNVRVIEILKSELLTAADSIRILKNLQENLLETRIIGLQKTIEEENALLKRISDEYETLTSEGMRHAYKVSERTVNQRVEKAKRALEIYKKNPELTQWGIYQKRINELIIDTGRNVGVVVHVLVHKQIKDISDTTERQYLFCCDSIIGQFNTEPAY